MYVADVLAAWASHYIGVADAVTGAAAGEPGVVTVSETHEGKFTQNILVGAHMARADEPASVGGNDSGFTPYDLLLAGLGACTSMTLRMYAEQKKWPLEHVSVRLRHQKIHAEDCATCETREGRVDHIERDIAITGALDDTQRARLMEIADKCPVHRTLHSEVSIVTRTAPP